MTVVIDKMVVISSPDEKTRDRNILYLSLGAMVGAIFPNLISFLIFTDMYSIPTWSLFFFLLSLAIIPMILVSFFLKESIDMSMDKKQATDENIDKRSIVLICILTFLVYSDRLYQYPLEPWILEKYGEQYFSLLLLILIFLIILNAVGVIIAGIISNKYNRKKILLISLGLYGSFHIILPFSGMIVFFVILGIMQIVAGFTIINLKSFWVKFSYKKVFLFQIFYSFLLLAVVLLTPLGTYLSSFISTELIIVTVGVLTFCGIIPVILLKYKKE